MDWMQILIINFCTQNSHTSVEENPLTWRGRCSSSGKQLCRSPKLKPKLILKLLQRQRRLCNSSGTKPPYHWQIKDLCILQITHITASPRTAPGTLSTARDTHPSSQSPCNAGIKPQPGGNKPTDKLLGKTKQLTSRWKAACFYTPAA